MSVANNKRLERLRYRADLRKLIEKADGKGYMLWPFEDAEANYICVVSMNDFEVGEPLTECDPSNCPYFIDSAVYSMWCDELD